MSVSDGITVVKELQQISNNMSVRHAVCLSQILLGCFIFFVCTRLSTSILFMLLFFTQTENLTGTSTGPPLQFANVHIGTKLRKLGTKKFHGQQTF